MPIDALLASSIFASLFRLSNAFSLAVSPHVSFKLGKDSKHSEEGTAGGRGGIHALLNNLEVGTSCFDLMCNVSKVS